MVNDLPRTSEPRSLQDAIRQLSGGQLHALLDIETSSTAWTESDLPALWNHQLKTAIIADIAAEFPESSSDLQRLCLFPTPQLSDISSLLRHPTPPAQLLDLVRRAAKTRATRDAGTGFDRIARILYFAILAAMIKTSQREPTKLAPVDLRKGFAWALSHAWLDAATADLIRFADEVTRSSLMQGEAPPAPGR